MAFFVPELLIAQRAMKEALKLMSGAEVDYVGTVVIGTVKGDLHDIGKNLVAAMMEGAGFKVVDLGVDVSPEAFVQAATENNAIILRLLPLLQRTSCRQLRSPAHTRHPGRAAKLSASS